MTTKEDQQKTTAQSKTFWSEAGDGCGCAAMILCAGIAVSLVVFVLAWSREGFPAFWK